MSSVYKKGRDEGKKGSVWYFDYTDHTGKRVSEKGFTDRQATRQLSWKREHEAAMRRKGLIDPVQESFAKHRVGKIADHVAAFKQFLESGSNTAKHVKTVVGRIQRILNGCKAKSLASLDKGRVEAFLIELRKETDHGPRTHNHYIEAIDSFGRWMVDTGRVAANPFAGLKKMNARLDVRRTRRALTDAELGQLIHSARTSNKSIQRFDGEARARLYILAATSGLRRNELASLTPESFKLDASPPTITVEAVASKHRKTDVLPVHPDVVPLLREWLPSLEPGTKLFPRLGRRRTWLTVKKDLERVGIPYETAEGVADFHAAGRHTFVSRLDGLATPTQVRDLARHSTLGMTSQYSHSRLEDRAAALARRNCQWIGSGSTDKPSPEESAPIRESGSEVRTENDETPIEDGGSVVDRPSLAGPVKTDEKWRRRELNPKTNSTQVIPLSTIVHEVRPTGANSLPSPRRKRAFWGSCEGVMSPGREAVRPAYWELLMGVEGGNLWATSVSEVPSGRRLPANLAPGVTGR